MAERTLDAISARIRSLDDTIARTSALLDSMLPVPRTQTPIYDQYMAGEELLSYDDYIRERLDHGFEFEEVMSDISDDETIPYLNEYDDGDVDDSDDDVTVVPDWQDPFWTPPAAGAGARRLPFQLPPRAINSSFQIYRPSYLDDEL